MRFDPGFEFLGRTCCIEIGAQVEMLVSFNRIGRCWGIDWYERRKLRRDPGAVRRIAWSKGSTQVDAADALQ